jgi:rhamnosyltransferase
MSSVHFINEENFRVEEGDVSVLEKPLARPQVAVCLAAYNGVQFIGPQIESILAQESVDITIFVSVDRSTDGTEALLADWARREPRISLLPFGQRFGGAAPNFYRLLRDVDLTTFDYVSLADQDDLWHPRKLWRAHCVMRAHDADGYSSNVTAFWPSGRTELVNKAQAQCRWDFMFEASGPGCTYVFRTVLALRLQALMRRPGEMLSKVGYHDWLIYAFARNSQARWVIDEWSSMQYRQHAHNQIGVNSGLRSYLVRARKMLSGHGFEQSLLIGGLIGAEATPVVQGGLRRGRLGYWWLAFRATQCRRKRIDQLWFFILCVLCTIFPPSSRGDA